MAHRKGGDKPAPKPLPSVGVLLSFAARARCVVAGDEGCRQAVKRRKAGLVLYARDAALERIAAMEALCAEAGIPLRALDGDPGEAIGKPGRKWIAVTEPMFAEKLRLAPEGAVARPDADDGVGVDAVADEDDADDGATATDDEATATDDEVENDKATATDDEVENDGATATAANEKD